jgi:hypothetical protein
MTLERFFGTWLALAILMTANGMLREAVLRRWLSGEAPDVISAVLGAVIILGTTRLAFRRFSRNTTGALVQSALLLLTLTVAYEFAIGWLVDRKGWSELTAHYAFWRGELWPYLLVLLVLTPFVWGRWFVAENRGAH